MKLIITGSSGFIGFHASKKFLDEGHEVYGIDCENDYYDVSLKAARREILCKYKNFSFVKADLGDESIKSVFEKISPKKIIHLAAQAGVRHSLTKPGDYVNSNIIGTLNILEFAKGKDILENVVLASTSSVYGGNTVSPFSEMHGVDHPLQFYAVSKRATELMGHSYSNLFNVPITVLRFFTVYGPWGRPDMALFKFTKNIIEGKSIDVFNNGKHKRDFTYVDDIVEGIFISSLQDPMDYSDKNFTGKNPSSSYAPFKIFNIGAGRPEELEDFITEIERNLGKKAIKNYLPIQPGDVESTHADISALSSLGYKPKTTIDLGVKNFIHWYLDYYC
tara:strand:- start:5771 stop:6772 length:1002 start_codon:yes stop_codon:yes gene_type:complete